MNARETATEQLELFALNVRVLALMVREAQERALFRACVRGDVSPCPLCRIKRYTLRKRYR